MHILEREHGYALKNLSLFVRILKCKVAVGCLAEVLTRYCRRRKIGLLTGLPFTTREMVAMGKVFLIYFLQLRKLPSAEPIDIYGYSEWNYYFSLLKEASGVARNTPWSIMPNGLLTKQGLRLQSSEFAGTPGSFSVRNIDELPDTFGDLLYLSRALLKKPISGKVCWWCSRSTSIKLQKCSICSIAHYCSQECQKKDWSGHKLDCRLLQGGFVNIMKGLRRSRHRRITIIKAALDQTWHSAISSHAMMYLQTELTLRQKNGKL